MERIRYKKCAKCGEKKVVTIDFPKHSTSYDGYASYCKKCRNKLHDRRSKMNVRAYLKHHMATRITKQLEPNLPSLLVKRLDVYLGYTISELRAHLEVDLQRREGISVKEAIKQGYHLDHIHPLSKFVVTNIDSEVFRKCWAINNLSFISAEENLKKGAKVL